MSYSVDELFRFKIIMEGVAYGLAEYLKKDDPSVTKIVIPNKYNEKTVIIISPGAFSGAGFIESVKFPDNGISVGDEAFKNCGKLKALIFKNGARYGKDVFLNCEALSKDVIDAGIAKYYNLSEPFDKEMFERSVEKRKWNSFDFLIPPNPFLQQLSPDIFEVAVKNDCFRNVDMSAMLKFIIRNRKPEVLDVAEKYGILDDAKLLDSLIEYSAEQKSTEMTAYLLELKKRKFGFTGGDNLEL